jgi:hypothetical protein
MQAQHAQHDQLIGIIVLVASPSTMFGVGLSYYNVGSLTPDMFVPVKIKGFEPIPGLVHTPDATGYSKCRELALYST